MSSHTSGRRPPSLAPLAIHFNPGKKPPKRKKNENPIVWMSKIKLEESVVEELVVPEPKRKPRRPAGSKSKNKTCLVKVGGKMMKIKMEEVQANVDAKDSG